MSVSAKRSLEDLRPVTQKLVIGQRPKTAIRASGGSCGSKMPWHTALRCESASSVLPILEENVSTAQLEELVSQQVQEKKNDLKTAFRALDPEGQLTVTEGEFRGVIEGLVLPLTHAQFKVLLDKVPKNGNGKVAYLEFLGKYSGVLTTENRCPLSSEHCTILAELQHNLRDKIGANSTSIIRAFRLFDCHRDGKIHGQELRRVLEAFCFPMSDQEFHKLWSHYCPNKKGRMSYEEFLEKLSINCGNHALNWSAVDGDGKGASCRRRSWVAERKAVPIQSLRLEEIQTVFIEKMRSKYADVQQALQAFDVTHSGVVSWDNMKAVLSNLLFPLSDITFQNLMSRYGVKATGPVSWRQFLAQFWNLDMGKEQTLPGIPQPTPCREDLVQELPAILQKLKEHAKNKDGKVTPEEFHRMIMSLNICLTDNQFGDLITLLDPDHTGVISYRDFQDIINPWRKSMVDLEMRAGKQKTCEPNTESDETSAWSAVGVLLQDKLSLHWNMVMVALQQCDRSQSGVSEEELRKIIKQYELPLSDARFNTLCEPCMNSGEVRYRQFLKSLGLEIPISNMPRAPSLSDRKVNSNIIHSENTRRKTVEDLVLKELHESLTMHCSTIHDHLRGIRRASDGALTVKDLRRILEDCRIFLEEDHFHILVEALGFRDGKLSQSEFLAKYEERISRGRLTGPKNNPMVHKPSNFLTAEQCHSLMKDRIIEFHGDIFTAFRFMDKNRDGLVSEPDFRNLYSSLRFITKETEYHRLLDLLGLTPGATLNYPEFFSMVQSNGSKVVHPCARSRAEPCDQIHGYLVQKAHSGWPDMAKALCRIDQDGHSTIFKEDLRNFLYTYAVPITPSEFNQLWFRYDKDATGCITQSEFFRKLSVDQDNKGNGLDQLTTEGKDMELKRRTDGSQMLHAKAKLQSFWQAVRQTQAELSLSLGELGQGHCVTVGDLLALLQKHCGAMEVEGEEELVHLLNSLGISVDNRKLSYLEFLSKFDGKATPPPPPPSCCVESPVSSDRLKRLELEKALPQVQGVVTASAKAFSKVLDSVCLGRLDHQHEYLLSKMSVKGDGTVNRRAFLQRCHPSCQEMSEQWRRGVEKAGDSSETNPVTMSDIQARIHKVVSTRLRTLTDEMGDHDYDHAGVISKADFRTISDRHFMKLTDDQFENLWKRLPVKSFGNLKYHKFLKLFGEDLKDWSLEPSAPVLSIRQRPKTASYSMGCSKAAEAVEQTKRPSTAGARTPRLLSCELLERKLQAQVCACWKDIQRRCRKVDTERLGEIDMDKFLAIMEDVRIEMSQEELEQLAVKYDIKNNGKLSYPGFLRNTALALRPPAQRAFRWPKVPQPQISMSTGELGGQCVDTMMRMQGLVQQFRRGLRQSFAALDRGRSGVVSLQDFRKVLRLYSIKLSEEEFFHLCSFFDKNISGKISYNDFLRTVLGWGGAAVRSHCAADEHRSLACAFHQSAAVNI